MYASSNAEKQYVGAQSALGGLQSLGNLAPEREPEVKEQIGALNIEVSELEGLVDSLERKFESVLQPSPPEPAGANGLASCKRTRVGEQLHTLSLRISTARSRIVSILERAEV